MKEITQVIAFDINQPERERTPSDGVAYYRLPDAMYEFLCLCAKKHGIIGFEFDGSRNFGVILGFNPEIEGRDEEIRKQEAQ